MRRDQVQVTLTSKALQDQLAHFSCDLKETHFTFPFFLQEKNDMCMCLRPQHPSAQRTGRMLWRSTCIFLCLLPSSLHSLTLTLSLALVLHIHSCDCPANEMVAPTVGTCFHLWRGGEKEKGRGKRRMRAEEEEDEEERGGRGGGCFRSS